MTMNNLHKKINEDMIGKKYEFLTVLAKVPRSNKKRGVVYLCECVCGVKKELEGAKLRAGHVRSCGCKTNELISKTKVKENSAFNRLLSAYKHSASERGLEFALTQEQFREIVNKECYYCGTLPAQESKVKSKNAAKFIYNGIDRKDNNTGYIIKNVLPCCKFCNYAKFRHTHEEFIAWVKRIYNHLQSTPTVLE